MDDFARQIQELFNDPTANSSEIAHLLLQMLYRIEALETRVLKAEIAASKGAKS